MPWLINWIDITKIILIIFFGSLLLYYIIKLKNEIKLLVTEMNEVKEEVRTPRDPH